ncbi:MAG: hypothetical protein RMJ37_01190 [Spirochaetia bacterium]|nr:hypothetical protein [Spirochaetota bacterium]MCX8096980.1 hypothetical protein [Spirochaetota bacterium]MDW8111937.1 hypothetical protein [Spirochaetia bacterium]
MKRLILVLAIVCLTSMAFGASFSAWVGMTGEGKFALNPFIYVPTSFDGITLDLAVAYGFSGNIDVIANLSSLSFSSAGFGWGGAWIMPRYDLGSAGLLPYNIIALQLGYLGNLLASLQYHTLIKPIDIFGIEFNASVSYLAPDFISLGAIIAPVVNIFGPLSIYFEFDPSFAISPESGFGYTLIGGIDLNFGSAGELSLGYNITSSTIVAWYFIVF